MTERPRTAALVVLLCSVASAGACGGPAVEAPPPPKPIAPASAAAAPKEAPSAASLAPPTMCLARERLTSLLAEGPLPPVPPDRMSAKMAKLSSGAKDADSRDLYARVAPATVLIRADEGMGTGTIIDPAGWVLTAYHVVDGAKAPDFTIKVSLEIGSVAKDGATKGLMQRGEKLYEAVVHKADPSRDLAILKITDPPPNLPHVKVAKTDVRPSEPITIVGHAGVGLLWAVKSGTVSTAGELGKNLAMLVLLECKADTPDDECKQKKKAHDRAVADLASMPAGLLIQSTVATTRGDSGGPVVNAAGELVGVVSFSNSDRVTGVAYSYHVHGAEIRQFVAEVPKKPAQVTPNPWCDGGFEAALEDADLDGQPDTLLSTMYGGLEGGLGGYSSRRAVMLDLDQDNFTRPGGGKPQSGAAPYDAELVLLTVQGKQYAYYDTNNDGRFDVLLVDERGSGVPTTAWRIDADGSMAREEPGKWRSSLKAAAFADAKLGQRLTRIAPVVFPGWATEGADRANDLPDPLAGAGKKGTLQDLDRDGRPDGISLTAAFSRGLLVDTDQDSLGELRIGDDPQALLNARKVDAEFSIIEQGSDRWAYYDTNKDGRFDLVLHGRGEALALGIASSAWSLEGRQRTHAPDHYGRKMVRPGLLSGADAARLRGVSRMYTAATDEGLGSLPDPRATLRRADAYFLELKGWPRAVAVQESSSSRALFVDADRNTKFDPKEKQPDVARMVATGAFDAEYAEFQFAGMMWGFYDTDDDGAFDLVLFTTTPVSGQVTRAFRVTPRGLESDLTAMRGKWVRPDAFTNKTVSGAMKKLSKDLFKPQFVDG